jgi:hypothetical protein
MVRLANTAMAKRHIWQPTLSRSAKG